MAFGSGVQSLGGRISSAPRADFVDPVQRRSRETGELAPALDFGAVVVNRLGCGLALCVLWARRPGQAVSGGEQSRRRRIEGVSMVRDRIGFCG